MNIYLIHGRLTWAHSARVFLMLFLMVSGLYAQDHSGEFLKPLTPDDYGKWESVRGAKFSDDGNWVSLITGTNEGDRTLTLRSLVSEEEFRFEDVNGIEFSPDHKWVVLRRTLPGKEMQVVREVKGEIEARAWLYGLETKDTVPVNNLSKYDFSHDGAFLAMTRSGDRGKSLLIRNMKTSGEISFGNVHHFEWHKDRNLLLIEIRNQKGNSEVQLYNAFTGAIKVIDRHNGNYPEVKWMGDSYTVQLVREHRDEHFREATHDVILAVNLDRDDFNLREFQPHITGLLGEHQRVLAEDIVISQDQNRIFFKVLDEAPITVNPARNAADSMEQQETGTHQVNRSTFYKKHNEAPDLQIWNSKDKVLVPAQNALGSNGVHQPKIAVWDYSNNSITFLSDVILENVLIDNNKSIFLGYDETPYEREVMFGRHFYDVYAVDSRTGKNERLVEKVSKFYALSPDSRYFVYLKNDDLHIFDLEKGRSRNLTSGSDVSFIDEHNDHPLPQKPAYGFVGWAEDGKSFLLNSEFDVWQFYTANKAPRALTRGRAEENIFRLDFTGKNEGLIAMDGSLLYTVEGKWTKRSGFAGGRPGSEPIMYIFEDAALRRIARKDDTGQLVFVRSSYDLPGDAFYTTDMFRTEQPLTAINVFQDEYRWSKAELIDYTTALGNRAQGVLYYPANYEAGQQYPMITYVYEKLSHGLHNYMQPSEHDYYNTMLWAQSGYFVFKPDMEFEAGNPGVSAARTLENAVAAVVKKGDVDADKVGLIGHSWGGYQAGFVPTQTDIFAASVAGAGLTDLVSMNLSVTPAFGWRPENDHFEVGQERMEVAPWVAPDKYVANSTVMQIHNLNTPVMFMTGDSDTNVNWSQGIAYYNAARRAGKDFVMLVYEGEGHSLTKKKNQIDYQQRILKWFGYHLKGEQPEDWMLNSVPYSEQQERLENWNK